MILLAIVLIVLMRPCSHVKLAVEVDVPQLVELTGFPLSASCLSARFENRGLSLHVMMAAKSNRIPKTT